MKTVIKIPYNYALVIKEEHIGCFMEILAQSDIVAERYEDGRYKFTVNEDPAIQIDVQIKADCDITYPACDCVECAELDSNAEGETNEQQ